jgi:hypothetical protein
MQEKVGGQEDGKAFQGQQWRRESGEEELVGSKVEERYK